MIKFIYKLFNHDKIDDLNKTLDVYKERNEQLEAELREYKGYKLKYEVTKLYVEDDEALLELFELAKQRDRNDYSRRGQQTISDFYNQAGYQQAVGIGQANAQAALANGLALAQVGQANAQALSQWEAMSSYRGF